MNENEIKIIFQNNKLSISEWTFESDSLRLSLVNTFRKWAYDNVKTSKVIGLRLMDSDLILENHEEIKETVLQIVDSLRSLNFNDSKGRQSLKFNEEVNGPLKAKKVFKNLDSKDFSKVLFHTVGKEKINMELIISDYLEEEEKINLVHDGKSFIVVSKDLNAVNRCSIDPLIYKSKSYRVVLETVSNSDHRTIMTDFLKSIKEIFEPLEIQDISDNTFSTIEDLALSDRSINVLKAMGINSLEDLRNFGSELDLGSLSLDSAKVVESFLQDCNEIK